MADYASGAQPHTLAAPTLDGWTGRRWDGEGIDVDVIPAHDRVLVRTRHAVYEMVVLPGGRGDVLVRGGRHFEAFTRAHVVGATAGGSTVKLFGIYPGLRLELSVGRRRILTSTVREVAVAGGGVLHI
jgi:hypothetical protein